MSEGFLSDGARKFIAGKASEFVKNLLSPKAEMTKRTLVVKCKFSGEKDVVDSAVKEAKRQAEFEPPSSMTQKLVFTYLRMIGFGRMKTTGEVVVDTQEISPGQCEVSLIIGVMVEDHEKLVNACQNMNSKIHMIPQAMIYKTLKVDPSKLNLESIYIEAGLALPSPG